MKPLLVFLLALPAWGQIAIKPAAASAPAERVGVSAGKIAPAAFFTLERLLDTVLASVGGIDHPVDLLGDTRGVYLEDYGVVFSAELSLIKTPGISPFHQTISEQERKAVHERKLEQLPALEKAMGEMMRTSAKSLTPVPENQRIVLVVRLLYMHWEDTSGLPAQIMLKADRTSAMAGRFQTEVQ